PRSPSGASARPSPRVSIKSLELNALHTSRIQDMVDLNGNRSSEAFAVDGPAIVDAVVVPNEFPNIPHFDLETIGNFARAKVKEAIIAVTGA
ncbi:MAG: hypothetical protein ABSA90_19475, partial [Xanthobacteraceae bacterium]